MGWSPKTLYEAIRLLGHDEDFAPSIEGACPTGHEPGTAGKIEVMRRRVELGQHLYHPDDARIDNRKHRSFTEIPFWDTRKGERKGGPKGQ